VGVNLCGHSLQERTWDFKPRSWPGDLHFLICLCRCPERTSKLGLAFVLRLHSRKSSGRQLCVSDAIHTEFLFACYIKGYFYPDFKHICFPHVCGMWQCRKLSPLRFKMSPPVRMVCVWGGAMGVCGAQSITSDI